METKEERKRRMARDRQRRRRAKLQGQKTISLNRCVVCGSEFIQRQTQGTPKHLCSRRCIDRRRYLEDKVFKSEGSRMAMVIQLKTGAADETHRRLFGHMHPDVLLGGDSARQAWNQQVADWITCRDLSQEEYRARLRERYAQELAWNAQATIA